MTGWPVELQPGLPHRLPPLPSTLYWLVDTRLRQQNLRISPNLPSIRHYASLSSPQDVPADAAHDAASSRTYILARDSWATFDGVRLIINAERGTSWYVPSHPREKYRESRVALELVGSNMQVAHTVSQRLRRLKQIPAELIPLGKPTRRSSSFLQHRIRSDTLIRRCCGLCRPGRRLLEPAALHPRQDDPTQASKPRGRRRRSLRASLKVLHSDD